MQGRAASDLKIARADLRGREQVGTQTQHNPDGGLAAKGTNGAWVALRQSRAPHSRGSFRAIGALAAATERLPE